MSQMNTNVSPQFLDLIYETALIQEGSPRVYRLPTKPLTTGTLTKKTIGVKDTNRGNKTLLLFGETGAGKSTLLNSLYNFALGVKWEDEVWFEIADDHIRSGPQRKTSDLVLYEIHGDSLDFSLTVIDTPGFGDTKGTDEGIFQMLTELFRSGGVGQVHAVGLVLKASENRLSDRMAYVLNSVASLFGKNMERNIVALITHSNGRRPTNALQALEAANIQCARDENNDPVYFLFDNCQRDDRTEGTQYLNLAFDTTMKHMELFTEFLKQQESAAMTQTNNVQELRRRLRDFIQNLQKQVESIESTKEDIQQTAKALSKYHQKMEMCRNFETEEIEVFKDKENVDTIGIFFQSGALCCTKCEENCHYPGCTWAPYPSQCEVMKSGNCTVCPGKCPVKNHVKGNWKYVERFRKVTKTNEEMKERFERNQKKHKTKLEELNNLQKNMSDLDKSKTQSLNEIFRIIEELEETALNVNAVSTYVHLDFLIQQMKETGDTQKIQKLDTMRDRMDEKNKAGAEYLKTNK